MDTVSDLIHLEISMNILKIYFNDDSTSNFTEYLVAQSTEVAYTMQSQRRSERCSSRPSADKLVDHSIPVTRNHIRDK